MLIQDYLQGYLQECLEDPKGCITDASMMLIDTSKMKGLKNGRKMTIYLIVVRVVLSFPELLSVGAVFFFT